MRQTPYYAELSLGQAQPLDLDSYTPTFWQSMTNAFKSALAYNPSPAMQRWADTHPDQRQGAVWEGMDDFAAGGNMGITRDVIRDQDKYGGYSAQPPAQPASGLAASLRAAYAEEAERQRIVRMPTRWQAELIEKEGLTGLVKPHPDYDERALRIVLDGKKRQLDEQRIADAAPGWHAPFSLAAGLAAGLLDPVAIASSFVPAVSEARALTLLSHAGGSFFKRQLARAGMGAANAAAGAALLEPVIYSSQQAMQQDYGVYQSMLNIGMGAALGAALHPTAGAVREWWAKRADIHLPWQMGRATPQSLAMQERLAASIRETRLAANPLQDAEQVRKSSLADAMTYDAAMRRLAWAQGIETHEAYALGNLRLENGERANQTAKAHELRALALEQELAELAERDRLAAAHPELAMRQADSWRVSQELEAERFKAKAARAEAARELRELLGSDSNFARYVSPAQSVEEFVARVATRKDASQGSVYMFGDRILQRADGKLAGLGIQLGEDRVSHIGRRHSNFNDWDKIPDVVEQGICVPLKDSKKFEPGAEAYVATFDNKVMLVVGHQRHSKNKGNRFEIHTALVDSPGFVNEWLKNNAKDLQKFDAQLNIEQTLEKKEKADAIFKALPIIKLNDAAAMSVAGPTAAGLPRFPAAGPGLSTGIKGYPASPRSENANLPISPAHPEDIGNRNNALANGENFVNAGDAGEKSVAEAASTDTLPFPAAAPDLSGNNAGQSVSMRSENAVSQSPSAQPEDFSARDNTLANGENYVNGAPGQAGEPGALAQRGVADGHERLMGAITFADDFAETGAAVIRIFESHDSTTVRHELAHLLRRTYGRMVESGDATELLARHYRKLEREFGVEPGGRWNEAQEERFAAAFVSFIANGQAPTPALQTAFSIMREQAGAMYADADAAGVRISESMRDLFNSMLTTPLEEGDRLFRAAIADINTRRWEQEFLPAGSRVAEPGQALGLNHEPSEAADALAAGRPALEPGEHSEVDRQIARLEQLNGELRAANDRDFVQAGAVAPELRERLRNERDAATAQLDAELARLPEDAAIMEQYVACLLA